jgi:hypothetical protein
VGLLLSRKDLSKWVPHRSKWVHEPRTRCQREGSAGYAGARRRDSRRSALIPKFRISHRCERRAWGEIIATVNDDIRLVTPGLAW